MRPLPLSWPPAGLDKLDYWESEDPVEDLRESLRDDDAYYEALDALGLTIATTLPSASGLLVRFARPVPPTRRPGLRRWTVTRTSTWRSSTTTPCRCCSGTGDGTFAAAVDYAGESPTSVAAGDLDGDADLDLAVANYNSSTESVLLGNGDATFAAAVDYAAGESPRSVTMEDLDGDGDLDLAVANLFSGAVSVLLAGASDATAPAVTITLAPAAPDGSSGWYVSPVGVAVSADDGSGSGVAETRCVLDPAAVPGSFDDLPASCAVTSVGADGTHAVYAASKDNDGNTSAVVSSSFMIDQTAPTVTCGVAAPGRCSCFRRRRQRGCGCI